MELHPDAELTLTLSPEQERLLDLIQAEYQETRHHLKNQLAILMAMAEMAERNPERAPRLIQCILEKGPQMVESMDALTAKLEDMRAGEGTN